MAHAMGANELLTPLDGLLPDLEKLYTDVHAHPELSMQETRTAGLAADRLRAAGYEVTTGVGKTGVVGLLRNGDGPTVMLRADMDALPVKEATGLPYASTVTATDRDGKTVPVMHACGHDMHVTWLAGATTLLAQARDALAGHADGGLPAGRGDRARRAGDDRRRAVRALPQARRRARPARHGRARPAPSAGRAGVITSAGGQPADPAVRARRARLDAAGQHRPGGDGGGHGAAPADHRLARARRRPRPPSSPSARCRPARRRTSSPTRRSSSSTCAPSTRACASACSPRSSGSSTPKRRPRARPGRRRSRRWTATALVGTIPRRPQRVVDAFRRHFPAERVRETGPASASEDFGSFRRRVARAVGVLVRRRHRSRHVREGQGGRQDQRAPDQPQPALCAGHPSHAGRPAWRRWRPPRMAWLAP